MKKGAVKFAAVCAAVPRKTAITGSVTPKNPSRFLMRISSISRPCTCPLPGISGGLYRVGHFDQRLDLRDSDVARSRKFEVDEEVPVPGDLRPRPLADDDLFAREVRIINHVKRDLGRIPVVDIGDRRDVYRRSDRFLERDAQLDHRESSGEFPFWRQEPAEQRRARRILFDAERRGASPADDEARRLPEKYSS